MRTITPLVLLLLLLIGCPSPGARADQFVTGQAAASVLGQADLNSGSTANAPNQFLNPESVAIDPVTGNNLKGQTIHKSPSLSSRPSGFRIN